MKTKLLAMTLLLAVSPCRLAAAQQPPSAEAVFNRAVEHQRQSDWPAAVAAWRAFLKLEPKHPGAHANLGTALSHLGQYAEAIASFETALQLNPALTPLLYNLSLAHFRAGQYAKAATALNNYISLNPNFPPARQLLGLTLVELGRDAEAVAPLETILANEQIDAAGLYALGLAYVRLRRQEFKALIPKLAALPGGAALSHLLAGQAHLRAAEYQSAITEFETASKLNAELPRLYFSLGVAYLRAGRSAEAANAFAREWRTLPQDFWTLYYLAYLDEAEGKLEVASARLKTALTVEPQSAEANALLGKILLRQGQAVAAVAPLETAVAQTPTDSNTRFLLARAYQQSGRSKDAAREFAEVQRLKNQGIEKERSGSGKPD